MRRVVIGVALAATSVFLVGCGATDEDEQVVTYTPPEQSNVTESEAPVTKYSGDRDMYDVYVFSITENGRECIVASSTQAVALQCEGMETP